MSGGHFNENGYIYFRVEQFADELESAIDFNEDDEEGGGTSLAKFFRFCVANCLLFERLQG